MKTILLYGDSNTWGYEPLTGKRFPHDVRWPGVCRAALGTEYFVIEEGLGGRTTVWEDPIESHRNGLTYLIPCLNTHKPLDLVAIMLGTNDLKQRFNVPASDIGAGAARLVETTLNSSCGPFDGPPKVLLICPPPVAPLSGTPFAEMFEGAEEKSRRLAGHYKAVAQMYGVGFLNAGEVVASSPLDAIHLEAAEHRKLGEAVAAQIRELTG